jgi:hypothetical protein
MTDTAKPKRSKKKKAGIAAIIVAVAIALLEAYPHILTAIHGGDTKPLAEFGKTKLYELQDAGTFTE